MKFVVLAVLVVLVFGAWCAGYAHGWRGARDMWSAERERYRELLEE